MRVEKVYDEAGLNFVTELFCDKCGKKVAACGGDEVERMTGMRNIVENYKKIQKVCRFCGEPL